MLEIGLDGVGGDAVGGRLVGGEQVHPVEEAEPAAIAVAPGALGAFGPVGPGAGVLLEDAAGLARPAPEVPVGLRPVVEAQGLPAGIGVVDRHDALREMERRPGERPSLRFSGVTRSVSEPISDGSRPLSTRDEANMRISMRF